MGCGSPGESPAQCRFVYNGCRTWGLRGPRAGRWRGIRRDRAGRTGRRWARRCWIRAVRSGPTACLQQQ